nr:putative f-box/kelch-repeat protein [Quercus suber]
MKDGAKYKWYSIPVPYYAASDDEAEAEAEAEKKLSPFSVVELPKLFSIAVLKSSIYCLSDPPTKTWIFDGCCWKLGPQMNVRRADPDTIVLSGKLYVLGGLYEDAREEYIWMEVLNPKRRAWRPLPNPPLRIRSFGMVSAALDRTKQIIVSAFLRGDSKVHRCYDYSGCVVYIYNVRTCCWTELEPPTINLRCGSPITRGLGNRAVIRRRISGCCIFQWFQPRNIVWITAYVSVVLCCWMVVPLIACCRRNQSYVQISLGRGADKETITPRSNHFIIRLPLSKYHVAYKQCFSLTITANGYLICGEGDKLY